MAKYNIGGYIFNDENSAKKAAKELKAVEYILGQIRAADEQEVLKIYKKILDQKLFSTQVGLGFLNQLRQNLVGSGVFTEDEVPPIYTIEESAPKEEVSDKAAAPPKEDVQKDASADSIKETKSKPEKKSKRLPKVKKEKVEKDNATSEIDSGVIKRLKFINGLLMVCVFTLLLCVIGMFYVSSTINSPNILNYKETITDEFSTWKQQLDEREKELNEREAALEEREAKVSDIEGNQ